LVSRFWGFIGAKRKNAARVGAYWDVWTFVALDAQTILIPCFVVGKRDAYHARTFSESLAGRMSNRVQLSSDSLNAYNNGLARSLVQRGGRRLHFPFPPCPALAPGDGLPENVFDLAVDTAQFVLRPRFKLGPKRGIDPQQKRLPVRHLSII